MDKSHHNVARRPSVADLIGTCTLLGTGDADCSRLATATLPSSVPQHPFRDISDPPTLRLPEDALPRWSYLLGGEESRQIVLYSMLGWRCSSRDRVRGFRGIVGLRLRCWSGALLVHFRDTSLRNSTDGGEWHQKGGYVRPSGIDGATSPYRCGEVRTRKRL